MTNKNGLTMIEMIAVLVILGIISVIATLTIGNIIDNSRLKADKLTINSINVAIGYYNLNNPNTPLNEQDLTEEEVINLLVDHSYLSMSPEIRSNNAYLVWSSEDNVFRLNVSGQALPLSPYGDTFEEIAPNFINDIQTKYDNTGSYGRTWGDYRYTDIGLDPDDWENPILHITYVPSGSSLKLEIEDGYEAVFELETGETYVLPASYNYSIIYSDLDEQWYYHSIDEDNLIDIATLEIRVRS